MMRVRAVVIGTALCLGFVGLAAAGGQDEDSKKIPAETLLDGALQLLEQVEGRIWPGWENTPTGVLLLSGGNEYLVATTAPPDQGFTPTSRHIAGLPVYKRGEVFSPDLLATFPAFGPPSIIIIGTPEAASASDARWFGVVGHEHFHQYQFAIPNYYTRLAALGLDGGDTSGMWMLNYPFPYEDEEVGKRFARMSAALILAYQTTFDLEFGGDTVFGDAVEALRLARKAFKDGLKPTDYGYFAFQSWQEGIARYAEYQFAQSAGEIPGDDAETGAIDPLAMRAQANLILQNSLDSLANPAALADQQRVAFYSFGHLEGHVLDALSRDWKERYSGANFDLAGLYDRH